LQNQFYPPHPSNRIAQVDFVCAEQVLQCKFLFSGIGFGREYMATENARQ
jgi:hypothetical protein